ncbi:MAG: CAP domain-containing protein [Pseudomonadota bacterium]|nr:CAP domain-containing protein [Pseudomonadota bacterium]
MKALLANIVVLIFASPQTVGADALEAVDWARRQGCGPAMHEALQSNAKLRQAAARLAAGAQLHDALRSLGYLAAQSSSLHLSGSLNDGQVRQALAANFCATLTNPRFREIGAARRGRDVWLVLAEPVSVPSAADAPSVNRRIVDLLNEARGAGRRCGGRYFPPVPPLKLNTSLAAAALGHSRDMAQYGEFEHRGHDGSTPEVRVRLAGYGPYRIVGENIAAGAMSAAEVTQGWLASPPHCENIMDGRFTQIGIAFAANLRSRAGIYWTQDFAAPR